MTAGAPPPPANRGAEIHGVVDWLSFSVWGLNVDELCEQLQDFGLGGWRDVDKGFRGYRRQRVGVGGARVLSEGQTPELHVELSGSACALLGSERMLELLRFVLATARVSRLDLAGDDATRSVLPEDLHRAQLRGEMVTHAQRWALLISGGLGGGSTFSVGTRGSRQFLRAYDKGAESHGEHDVIRFELEFRDEMAQQVCEELTTHEWGEVWASRLLSFVDFRDRAAHRDSHKCPRMAWWEALVKRGQKWPSYAPVKLVTVEKSRRWIERQVFPALALVLEVDGGPTRWFTEGLEQGERRWSSGHREALAAARAA